MQAILANMQASEENDSTLTEESQKYQLERIAKILTEIEAGQMKVYSLEEAWTKIDSQKSARKGA